MRCDILAILVTIVTLESAFSVGRWFIDESWASLNANIVEASITTRDCLQSRKKRGNWIYIYIHI